MKVNKGNVIKKNIYIILILIIVLILIPSCSSNAITPEKLEDKTTNFILEYFDNSNEDSFSCELLFSESNIEELLELLTDKFSDFYEPEYLESFVDDYLEMPLFTWVMNSRCFEEPINISNIRISLPDTINQESNIITAVFDVSYDEMELLDLTFEITFNEDLLIVNLDLLHK
ncbi:hypothetical protein RJI07_04780 [Mycoplasmatota bacterium WC30]